ncbi:MAG: spermidine synthase [Planctomycetota bacterium]|nr:spermidine synthase [Planctomycetota bacterium]
MSRTYEELDRRTTCIGELVLRRRIVPGLGPDQPVYEIKRDDELLMSSLVHDSEVALAQLAIPHVGDGIFDVLVGGLGLGYTAWAALGYERVRSVRVVELVPEVIEWHRRGLVPLGTELAEDPRCRLMEGDFFLFATDPSVRDLVHPADGYGAILVDIDHAPDAWLRPQHGGFYGEEALTRIAELLQPGGVFALWSCGEAQPAFEQALASTFPSVTTERIEVYNPLADRDQTDTIYLAKRNGSIPIPTRARPMRRPATPPAERPRRRR